MAEVIALVNARMASDVIPAASIFIGDEHLKVHFAPPRLVWILTTTEYQAPKGDSRRSTPGSAGPAPHPGARAPKAVFSKLAAFEAHLWGASLALAEALEREFVLSCKEVARAALAQMQGVWPEERGGGDLNLGVRLVIKGAFSIPILDRAPTLATVAQQQRIMQHTQPDGDVVTDLDQTESAP